MLLDLFSSLDFNSTNLIWFNSFIVWVVSVMWLVIFIGGFWFSYNSFMVGLQSLVKGHLDSVKVGILNSVRGSYLLIWCVFTLVLVNNLWGMVYCVFGSTTQIVFTVLLSFSFWVSIVCSSLLSNFNSFFGHLTPSGSPLALLLLLNNVELLSVFIRFITLSLRLTINISTGHIFVGLLSFCGLTLLMNSGVLSFGVVWMVLFFYTIFEVGVCFLQGFVYSLLLVQYLDEHA